MTKFIADMDRAGVEVGVLRASNKTLARVCQAYRDRLVGLSAALHIQHTNGLA